MTLASRISVMDRGVIRQTGTPTEIYEFPRSRFVADFIGSINLFEGHVTSSGGGKTTVACEAIGEITVDHARPVARDAKVSVAVRPEKIGIEREAPEAGLNAVRGKVTDLGYFGKDSLYRVKLPSGTLVRVNRVNDRRAGEGERVAVWEDEVWLSFEPSAAILLQE